jgi:hypothetical protein
MGHKTCIYDFVNKSSFDLSFDLCYLAISPLYLGGEREIGHTCPSIYTLLYTPLVLGGGGGLEIILFIILYIIYIYNINQALLH